MSPLLSTWISQTHLVLALSSFSKLPSFQSELWFSQEGIVRAEASQSQVLIKAQKIGRVYAHGLHPKSEVLTIDVVNARDLSLYKACAAKYFQLSSLPPRFEGNLEDLEKILSICPLSQIQYNFNSTKQSDQSFISHQEQKLRNAGVRFEYKPGADSQPIFKIESGSIKRAKNAVHPFESLFQWEEHKAHSQPGRTLLFEMGLVEISHSKISSLGLSLPNKINFDAKKSGLQLDPQALTSLGINFQNIQGLGKVVAQPKLRVRPGQKASFQSGGEIPVPVKGVKFQSIEWKPYGLILGIEPNAEIETGAQQIRVNFEIEMSEPDTSLISTGSTPAIKQSKLKSSFDLRTSELTILGTLFQSRNSNSKEGPWGLSAIPLIGNVFSKKDHIDQSSELWIVVKASWEEIPIARFSHLESQKSERSIDP